jgi:DNA-binding MarR family transcriptional regulator
VENRRQVDISITSKGLELLSQIEKDADNFHQWLKVLSETEAKQINDYLDKLRV